MSDDFLLKRLLMVQTQLIPRGIHDERVLKAMEEVPRHLFVPVKQQRYAYEDGPLDIGEGQTISQPYIVALMIQEAVVNSTAIALEIGTGSGYAAAVLSKVCQQVYTVERLPALAQQAQERLHRLEFLNVEVITGDGTLGYDKKSPYDVIITTAGGPITPKTLKQQLKTGGNLVIPVGDQFSQELLRITALPDHTFSSKHIEYVRFVPLIGEEGWKAPP